MFDKYPQYEYLFAQMQLVLFMLAMGATLTPGDFTEIVRKPRFFFIGVVCHLVIVPLLAVLTNWLGRLEAGIAVGLVLVAAMPGGTTSKLFTYFGRGNLALSISLTVCFTLAAIVTVPLQLRLLAVGYIPEGFQMPVGAIVRDVALYLLLPLGVGMMVARLKPAIRYDVAKWCARLGLVVVVVMVTGSLGSGRIHPLEYGWRTPLAIILFCVAAQQLVMVPGRLLGWPPSDRLAIAIELTMRSINLGLLLKALLFPIEKGQDPVGDGVLFVLLFYAAVSMIACVPLTLNERRFARRMRAREAQAEGSKEEVKSAP